MTAIATVTSKGQITIPKNVRESLRLHAGDKLEFVVTHGGEVLLRPVTRRVDEVFGRLHQPGRKPVPVEDMDRGIQRAVRAGLR